MKNINILENKKRSICLTIRSNYFIEISNSYFLHSTEFFNTDKSQYGSLGLKEKFVIMET